MSDRLSYSQFLLSFICRIAARRDAIISRRQRVKQLSADRKVKLMDSLVWQRFSRDADEVRIVRVRMY